MRKSIKIGPFFNQSPKNLLNLETQNTIPQLIFVFVLVSSRTTDKYGERGARFALIEVGHTIQNLALRIAKEKMKGFELGGLMDDQIKDLIGLKGTDCKVALGYTVGH